MSVLSAQTSEIIIIIKKVNSEISGILYAFEKGCLHVVSGKHTVLKVSGISSTYTSASEIEKQGLGSYFSQPSEKESLSGSKVSPLFHMPRRVGKVTDVMKGLCGCAAVSCVTLFGVYETRGYRESFVLFSLNIL